MNMRSRLLGLGFVRFGIVGVAATFIHVAVFSLLVELFGVAPVAASVPAFATAMLASYGVNRRWTFRAQGSHRAHLPRYALVASTGLGLNVLITYVVVNLLGYWYGLALAFVVTMVPAATFLLNRNWAFKTAPASAKLGTRQ